MKKTKSLVFYTKGRKPSVDLNFDGVKIENVRNYTYLGVTVSSSGCFNEAKTDLYGKGLKAYFKFCKSFGDHKPKVSTFLHIFDHTVKPVLLYGSEIWGTFHPNKLKNEQSFYKLCNEFTIEKLNIKACKFILGVNKRSTNAAVMGELGRFPLLFSVFVNIIKYWLRLVDSEDTLLQNALKVSQDVHEKEQVSWISCVYSIIEFLNLTPQHLLKKNIDVKKTIIKTLITKFKNCWENKLFDDDRKEINQKNKLRTYRLFKNKFSFEQYLNIDNFKTRNILCKFRIGMHNLEIETGRHFNVKVTDRICKLCKKEVEDEIHFLLTCEKLTTARKPFIDTILNINNNLKTCSKKDLFIWMMSCEDPETLSLLSSCIDKLMSERVNVLRTDNDST